MGGSAGASGRQLISVSLSHQCLSLSLSLCSSSSPSSSLPLSLKSKSIPLSEDLKRERERPNQAPYPLLPCVVTNEKSMTQKRRGPSPSHVITLILDFQPKDV